MSTPNSLQTEVNLLVLTVLSRRGPSHGYGIANAIQELSEDTLRVDEGSLYPALHRMEEEDRLGTEPILILAGPDGKSIRVFQARLPGQDVALEYYKTADVFMDSETGSEWGFSGCATRGKRAGACLRPVIR